MSLDIPYTPYFLVSSKSWQGLLILFAYMLYYMVSCILLFALFFAAVHNPIGTDLWTHFWVTTRQLRTNKAVGIEHSGSRKGRSETQRQWIKECLGQRSIWAKVSRMFLSAVVVLPSHPDPLHISMSDSSVFWHTDSGYFSGMGFAEIWDCFSCRRYRFNSTIYNVGSVWCQIFRFD